MATTFRYTGWDIESGKQRSGTINAPDLNDAHRQLQLEGVLAEAVVPDTLQGIAGKQFHLRKPRVKGADIAWVARSLASTEEAGIPIVESLAMLANQRKDEPIGRVLADITDRVTNGASLAEAFSAHEKELGTITCALIKAGSANGQIGDALARSAHMAETRMRVIRKVRRAVAYPLTMFTICLILFFVIVIVLVPQFESLFSTLGGELPLPTQMMVSLSKFLRTWFWVPALLIIVGVLAFRRFKQEENFAYKVDEMKMDLPIFGSIFRISAITRCASALAGLQASGVDIVESLDLSGNVAGNKVIAKAFYDAKDAVRQGMGMSDSFARNAHVPEMFTMLTRLGEKTGRTDDLLARYAKVCEEETEAKVDALTQILEPLVVVMICLVVGSALLSLYLPVFRIITLIQ